MTNEDWVKRARARVRRKCATGWSIRNRHNKVQLRVEGVGAVSLDYPWTADGCDDAQPRIELIFRRYTTEGISLQQAATTANTSSSKQKIDWDGLITEFRQQRPSTSDSTWRWHYEPPLRAAVALMTGNGKKPRDGEELLTKSLAQWEQGTRSRQIARRNLTSFLEYGVRRGLLKPAFLPPRHQPEVLKKKRVGFPLSDGAILRLLDDIQDERWRFAVMLCAEFGLRPEELRYLRIKNDQLWTIYEKSKGGRRGDTTDPRQLHSLPVRDLDGTPMVWNLQARIAADDELPPLREPGKAAQALTDNLKRRTVWKQLRAEAEHIGEQLTAYSFRHRYAKECHARGIPLADIAHAMGHTIDTHLLSYARFQPSTTAQAFAKAVNS